MFTISEVLSSVADLAREIRSSIINLDRRTFIGLLVGIVGFGLALEWAYWTTIALRIDLLRALLEPLQPIVGLMPFVVGALAYVRNRPAASALEIGLVVLWGACAIAAAYFFMFFFAPLVLSDVRISTSLVSGGSEFTQWQMLLYLGRTVVFAGLYAAAASLRDRPLISALVLLTLPAWTVGVLAIM
ncbi:hypothetical protein [Halosolutus halophilus]|uniref:hypothetical protein n=1 Tax=Halosolutus halophilus TaxID=1552990 RepID=UPI002234FF2C|nr:hypothetical protein [Halosolutus halophilus]